MQALKRPRQDNTAAGPDSVRAAIAGLLLEAMTCLSPTRVAASVKDLLGRLDPASLPPDRQAALMADSLMLATTLALFTPSSGGSTAVDRLAKQRRALQAPGSAAVAALRLARFRLLKIEDAGEGTAQLRDVASDQRVQVDEGTVTASFRAGVTDAELPTQLRRTATNSFQIDLGRGITAKLQALRDARETALRRSSGRDLVVVKAGIVDEELSTLGLNLRARSRSGSRRVLKDAFDRGHTAGLGFSYTPGVTQDG